MLNRRIKGIGQTTQITTDIKISHKYTKHVDKNRKGGIKLSKKDVRQFALR